MTVRQTESKNGQIDHFFVGEYKPFVGHKSTPIYPFIGIKIPFRCICKLSGFTLIELMVTLVVAAVLLTIAVPGFRGVIQSNRLTTQTNSLISDLQAARNQAIGRGPVVICTSSDGVSCNGAGWGSGRLIFSDATPNDYTYTPGSDTLIRYTEPLPDSISVTATNYPDPLIFDARGVLILPTGVRLIALATDPTLSGSNFFKLCDNSNAVPGRIVEIKTNGTPVVSDTAASCP